VSLAPTVAVIGGGQLARMLAEPAAAPPEPAAGPAPAAGSAPAPGSAPAVGSAPAGAPGAVYTAPLRPPRSAPDTWAMATAFGAGGVVALAGVAIGYLLGRRRTS